jgi:hypothetical protein
MSVFVIGAISVLVTWVFYKFIILLFQAVLNWLWFIATLPFKTGISLTAPDIFNGTYQVIVTPKGSYCRALVSKNHKVVEYILKPHSVQPINPVDALVEVETFSTSTEEVEIISAEASVLTSDKTIKSVSFDKEEKKVVKDDKKSRKSNSVQTQESAIDSVRCSTVPEPYNQLEVYLLISGKWILNGKAQFIRGRANIQLPYINLLQTSWHIVVDAIHQNSPMKIVNPQTGKFFYKYNLTQWSVRNESMDFAWTRVSDSLISKIGAKAYDVCLDFSYDVSSISIGQAYSKGASTYTYVQHSLIPMAINYKISTVPSDSGSALFILGKPLIIGLHNWGLNNNETNRGVCLIAEYRRFFLGKFERNPEVALAIPESDLGFSKRMRYLEEDALNQWHRENDQEDFYTRTEIDNYHSNYDNNRVTRRQRNASRPNDGGARYRATPARAVTLEMEEEREQDEAMSLFYSDNINIVPQAQIDLESLDRSLRAYLVTQRLNGYNIRSMTQFEGFLSYLDNNEYDLIAPTIVDIISDAQNFREVETELLNTVSATSNWADSMETESMTKAVNKNSRQLHRAKDAIESKLEKISSSLESLARVVLDLQRNSMTKESSASVQNFSKEASKQETPSSSASHQGVRLQKEKKSTSKTLKTFKDESIASLASSTSKNMLPKPEKRRRKSTKPAKTIVSPTQDPTLNFEALTLALQNALKQASSAQILSVPLPSILPESTTQE